MGFYKPRAIKTILQKTVTNGLPTSLGIVSMVCFAMIMDHCQMIYTLAEGINRVFGSIYPLVAPWIGLLGAFMTGSNTNSNVVFGALQQETAHLAGLSATLTNVYARTHAFQLAGRLDAYFNLLRSDM